MKKAVTIMLSVIILFLLYFYSVTPSFEGDFNEYELYLNSTSSDCDIIAVDREDFFLYSKVKGECVRVNADGFDVEKFFQSYSAKLLASERLEHGQSYYGYSTKLKYKTNAFGKTVNLHVFVGEEQVVIATPLIFGSY